MPRTIIIGTGISAIAYLATLRGRAGPVTVTGGPDLWNRMPGKHSMGQQAPLLTGNLLPGPRGFFGAPPLPGSPGFLTAEEFTGMLREEFRHSGAAHIPDTLVTRVRRSSRGGYRVKGTINGEEFSMRCRYLVMALGPGPIRMPKNTVDGIEQNMGSFGGRVVAGTDFLSPGWCRPRDLPRDATIAVYGGSATAAWVVEQAMARGLQLAQWFTRPGGTEFTEAFPPGERNTAIDNDTTDLRSRLALTGVAHPGPDDPTAPLMLSATDEHGKKFIGLAQILVFALGSDHNGPGGIPTILAASLHPELRAYYDHNRSISEAAPLLALGTADRSLMIVGSAMQSKAGFGTLKGMRVSPDNVEKTLDTVASYAEISLTLPPAARPPEGIAMVMAGIEALTDYVPATAVPGHTALYFSKNGTVRKHATRFRWDINFNTSNRTQLAGWLAEISDVEPFTANLAVALIVALRSGVTLGLSDGQVTTIVRRAIAWVDLNREMYSDMDARRMDMDKYYKNDTFMLIHLNFLTTDQQQIDNWHRLGVPYVRPPPPKPRRVAV